MENIETEQSYYYMMDINYANQSNFDRNIANIGPCTSVDVSYSPTNNALHFLTLHPTHGFLWDKEIMGEENEVVQVPRL